MVISGHTPLKYIHGDMLNVFFDYRINIIGIDTGAVSVGRLTCLRWPDKEVFWG